MDRRSLLVIAMLASLSVALWVLNLVLWPPNQNNQFTGPPRSDYTLNNFTLDALDKNGAHSFSVSGPRMARRGDDESSYVDMPDYQFVDDSDHTWMGNSDSAWITKDGTIMKLEGKVAMHRVPTDLIERVDILSTDLTITTDPKPKDAQGRTLPPVPGAPARNKRMDTQALTTIFDAATVNHGIGMHADSDLKLVQFFADVHTLSLPKERNVSK